MRSGGRSRLWLIVPALLWSLVPVAVLASNTPSWNQGDCWQPSTPLTCTWNHISQKGIVNFRAIDQFSSSRPSYSPYVHNGVNAWNDSPGPQNYSFTPASNDVWNYIHVAHTGQYGLQYNNAGITWLCEYQSGTCYDTTPPNPVEIWYSNIYLNTDQLDIVPGSYVQQAAEHESGHAFGLAHNTTDSNSIMWPTDTGNLSAPDGNDWGTYPGCSGGGHGTDCIYGWGD